MSEINTYPEMNAKTVDMLKNCESPMYQYAGARIEELEAQLTQAQADNAVKRKALALARSMIMSGESMTETAYKVIDEAFAVDAGQPLLGRLRAAEEENARLREIAKRVWELANAGPVWVHAELLYDLTAKLFEKEL